MAAHLLKACHYWTDTGHGTCDLHYLRNKEKEEIDFLVARDRRPWLVVEAKLSDETPARSFGKFLGYLGLEQGLQLVATPGVHRWHRVGGRSVLVASATVLAELV